MRLPDERLERIVFVTSRFAELRGLVAACTGAFLILGVIVWTLLPGDTRNVFQNVALLAGFGTMWAASGIESYYDRSYGRAPLLPNSPGSDPNPVMPGTIGALVMQMAIMLDMIKGVIHPGGGSLAAAGLIAYSMWVMVRDWRYRPHYLVGLAAGIAGLVLTLSVPVGLGVSRHTEPAVAVPYVVSYALIGLALVIVGLLDHRLLARAMGRGTSALRSSDTVPDVAAGRVRAILSGTTVLVVLSYITIAGWPEHAQFLYWSLYLTLMLVALTIHIRSRKDVLVRGPRAEAGHAWMEEEGADEIAVESLVPPPLPPPLDPTGHIILPIAMGAGALADLVLPGAGVPSLLASALALSHLRIAIRDWPSRKYYLLGTLAASISAIRFMFVSESQVFDWWVSFLILVCAAMLVEGLLDHRAARNGAGETRSKEHHADAI